MTRATHFFLLVLLYLLSPPLLAYDDPPAPIDPAARKGILELNFKWLKSRDFIERRDAAMALGILGDLAAVGPLIGCLEKPTGELKEQNREVRYWVVDALGKLKDTAAIRPLIRRLTEDPYPHIQEKAKKALIQIGKPARSTLESEYEQARYKGQQIEAERIWAVLSEIP